MEDKELTQQAESSPVTDEQQPSESSTEETQPSEATEQEAVEQTPLHEHPRFKEVIQEKNEYKQQAAELQQKLVEITSRITTPKDPEADPYAGLTPEEKNFYRNLDDRTQKQVDRAVQKAREEERKNYESQLGSIYKAYGELAANEFLRSHPDLKRGSPEMEDIRKEAFAISKNPTIEDLDRAYKIVMFGKQQQLAAEKEKQKQKQMNQAKAKANLEQKSVPPNVLTKEDFTSVEDAFKKAETDLDFKW